MSNSTKDLIPFHTNVYRTTSSASCARVATTIPAMLYQDYRIQRTLLNGFRLTTYYTIGNEHLSKDLRAGIFRPLVDV